MKKPSARSAAFDRRTTETHVRGRLVLDGRGQYDVSTGIRFLDHMLELFTRHGGFDLTLRAAGDLDVDQHHTVEDVGITLGEATLDALGNRKGINRAGYFVMPMDETLAVVAIDLGGRPHAVVDLKLRVQRVGPGTGASRRMVNECFPPILGDREFSADRMSGHQRRAAPTARHQPCKE